MSLSRQTPITRLSRRLAIRFNGAGCKHEAIAETLQAFYDLGCLLYDAKLSHVDDGNGLEQTSSVNRGTKFQST